MKVQLRGTGILQLAEVQVFSGTVHGPVSVNKSVHAVCLSVIHISVH